MKTWFWLTGLCTEGWSEGLCKTSSSRFLLTWLWRYYAHMRVLQVADELGKEVFVSESNCEQDILCVGGRPKVRVCSFTRKLLNWKNRRTYHALHAFFKLRRPSRSLRLRWMYCKHVRCTGPKYQEATTIAVVVTLLDVRAYLSSLAIEKQTQQYALKYAPKHKT